MLDPKDIRPERCRRMRGAPERLALPKLLSIAILPSQDRWWYNHDDADVCSSAELHLPLRRHNMLCAKPALAARFGRGALREASVGWRLVRTAPTTCLTSPEGPKKPAADNPTPQITIFHQDFATVRPRSVRKTGFFEVSA